MRNPIDKYRCKTGGGVTGETERIEKVNALVGQKPARGPSLLPREYGAYAEVAFPLLTALALGSSSAACWLLVMATVTVFLAHEPVLVLAGERGPRARAETGSRAGRAAVFWLTVASMTGALGWWSAPATARLALLLPLSLGALLVPLILGHRERTMTGELLVGLVFSSALIPVALAGGVSPRTAVIASAVWATVFSLATFTVRAVIASGKQSPRSHRQSAAALWLSITVIVAAILLPMKDALPALAAAAVVPSALVALVCCILEVHPRHLRRMGWSLVAGDVVALAALVAGLS